MKPAQDATVVQTKTLTDEDISYLCDLTKEAGLIALQMREGVSIQEKSGPHDMVTAADYELSRLIVERITARFPKDIIVSEEDEQHIVSNQTERVWLIDPIDGTDNYIRNDGQYAVMIGLLVNLRPVFGFVYAPAQHDLYFGGPGFGGFRKHASDPAHRFTGIKDLNVDDSARVQMGFRDRKAHPWVADHPKVTLVKTGSIGLKVARVLEDEADLFVHLSGKLKTWDTAGPAAIAIGAGLDVGSLEEDVLEFPAASVKQTCSVIIGRPGSLNWSRAHLRHPE